MSRYRLLSILLLCCLACYPRLALAVAPSAAAKAGWRAAPAPGAISGQDSRFLLVRSAGDAHLAGAPQIDVAPGEIVAAVPLGGSVTLPLTISNDGGGELVVHLDASGGSVSSLSTTPLAGYAILVVAPRIDANLNTLLEALDELSDIAYVVWDPARGAPTVADLVIYDVALVGNRHLWAANGIDADVLGDALADYIDLGGKVIDSLMVHSTSDQGLMSRYLTDGYAPVTVAAGYAEGDFEVHITTPDHTLMKMVTSISTHARLNLTARPDAIVPASYAGTSIPYVAANANVVSINQQLMGYNVGAGDLSQLLHNAVQWLCGERVPWLAVEPATATIAPGESIQASLTLNSANAPGPAVFTGAIRLDSNDPITPRLSVPVEMAALANAATGRLAGVVRSARTAEPLSDIQVQVQPPNGEARTCVTNERGAYSFWLTPATYAVTFSMAEYVAAQAEVSISPQTWVTHDATLMRDEPWLRLTPERIVAIDDGAGPLALAVAIANGGADPLSYAFEPEGLPLWVSMAPTEGLVAGGAQQQIIVQVDTAAAPPGWTVILAPLSTNDPWQSPTALRLYARRGQAIMAPVMKLVH